MFLTALHCLSWLEDHPQTAILGLTGLVVTFGVLQ